MIGIYKYTNKINNKIYIGLSNDIKRRYNEHLCKAKSGDRMYIHQAILKYGIENFDFEILETFEEEDRMLMGEREKYWISFYNSYENGYNETTGGDIQQGRSKLTKEDVIEIRKRYAKLERCCEVYEEYKHRINRTGFNKIWKGETWKSIMPEIYTPENRYYHSIHTGNPGERNGRCKMTEKEVIDIRTRKKNGESNASIYKDYSNKLTKGSFDNLVNGLTWKHIKV